MRAAPLLDPAAAVYKRPTVCPTFYLALLVGSSLRYFDIFHLVMEPRLLFIYFSDETAVFFFASDPRRHVIRQQRQCLELVPDLSGVGYPVPEHTRRSDRGRHPGRRLGHVHLLEQEDSNSQRDKTGKFGLESCAGMDRVRWIQWSHEGRRTAAAAALTHTFKISYGMYRRPESTLFTATVETEQDLPGISFKIDATKLPGMHNSMTSNRVLTEVLQHVLLSVLYEYLYCVPVLLYLVQFCSSIRQHTAVLHALEDA